jgi:hypothetical protein
LYFIMSDAKEEIAAKKAKLELPQAPPEEWPEAWVSWQFQRSRFHFLELKLTLRDLRLFRMKWKISTQPTSLTLMFQ